MTKIGLLLFVVVLLASCNGRYKNKVVKSEDDSLFASNHRTSELGFSYNKLIYKNGNEIFTIEDSNYAVTLSQADTGKDYYWQFTDSKKRCSEVVALDSDRQVALLYHIMGEVRNGRSTFFFPAGNIKCWQDIYLGYNWGGRCEFYEDGIRKKYEYFGQESDSIEVLTSINFDSIGRIKKFEGKIIASPIFTLVTKRKIRIKTIDVPYSRVKLTVFKNAQEILTTMDHEVLLELDTTAHYILKATYNDLLDKNFSRSETKPFTPNSK